MAKHEVKMTIPPRDLNREQLEFAVRIDDKPFGKLKSTMELKKRDYRDLRYLINTSEISSHISKFVSLGSLLTISNITLSSVSSTGFELLKINSAIAASNLNPS